MSVTNKCYFTIDLSPTFEAIYGRTSSLILLGQLKEVPKLYQGGKNHGSKKVYDEKTFICYERLVIFFFNLVF